MRPNFACAPDGEAPLLRHLPWPKLLDFWGLPNVRVINRDVHVVKSADEAAYGQSTRSLSLKSRVIERNCGSRAQSPALPGSSDQTYLWVWSAQSAANRSASSSNSLRQFASLPVELIAAQ